jgi:hypothetical protein
MYPGYKNCGPVALKTATGLDYEDIIHRWPGGWGSPTDDTGTLGIPNDTPYDHFTLLESFGLPYRLVDIDLLLSGQCKPGRTVLLLHIVKKPKNLWEKFKNFFKATFQQHWVTLYDYSPDKQTWFFDWGNNITGANGNSKPNIKPIDIEMLENLLLSGWPYCVYEVGISGHKPKWYQKLFARWV